MVRPWIGPARYLFIPLVVEATSGYDPPPPDYETFIQNRVFFDLDPVTGDDPNRSCPTSVPSPMAAPPSMRPWRAQSR